MIAVRPFSIHPNRSTEVKVRMIIDNFRIDLCPFNIMALIRNVFVSPNRNVRFLQSKNVRF
jgi:hypothetical protein